MIFLIIIQAPIIFSIHNCANFVNNLSGFVLTEHESAIV
jgi:hypothetical protein